jgi:hypothetical protein
MSKAELLERAREAREGFRQVRETLADLEGLREVDPCPALQDLLAFAETSGAKDHLRFLEQVMARVAARLEAEVAAEAAVDPSPADMDGPSGTRRRPEDTSQA